jgi:hypothetical protein
VHAEVRHESRAVACRAPSEYMCLVANIKNKTPTLHGCFFTRRQNGRRSGVPQLGKVARSCRVPFGKWSALHTFERLQ